MRASHMSPRPPVTSRRCSCGTQKGSARFPDRARGGAYAVTSIGVRAVMIGRGGDAGVVVTHPSAVLACIRGVMLPRARRGRGYNDLAIWRITCWARIEDFASALSRHTLIVCLNVPSQLSYTLGRAGMVSQRLRAHHTNTNPSTRTRKQLHRTMI